MSSPFTDANPNTTASVISIIPQANIVVAVMTMLLLMTDGGFLIVLAGIHLAESNVSSMTARYDTTLSPAERKRQGAFYTPDPVVRYLVRATNPQGPVVDLSCGDGAFLVEAIQHGCPVHGIDCDPLALAQAAERLAPFPQSQWNLYCGDGLRPELNDVPDVVLGNPPYLEAKKADSQLKARCREWYADIIHGGFDVFICFVKSGLDLLPAGGRLGYILPNKFLIAEYARPLRNLLLQETTIEEVIDVSDLPTFRDAAVYPVIIVLRKSPPPPGHLVRTGHVESLEQLDTGNFSHSFVEQEQWWRLSRHSFWLPPTNSRARQLVDRLMTDSQSAPLRTHLDLRWAVSFHRSGLRDEFVFPDACGQYPRKLLGGKRFHGNGDVRRYRISWSGWWIDYDEARAKAMRNQFPPLSIFSEPKILIAQNARRIVATLDTEGYVSKDTFILGRQRGDVPLAYLLGILNSSLMSYLYGVLFKATHVSGAYLHYLACYLNDLPIRVAEEPGHVTTLVQQLLRDDISESDRMHIDRQLDHLVYDLYDLTPEEQALVDDAVPFTWGDDFSRRGNWDARKCSLLTPQ